MDLVPSGRVWKSPADFFRPFRNAAASAGHAASGGEGVVPLYDPAFHHAHSQDDDDEEPDLRELNTALAVLVDLFPAVAPDVFREMLRSVSSESRVQVVAEQMLKQQKAKTQPLPRQRASPPDANTDLSIDDSFRRADYRSAVRRVLYTEFPRLSHSTVKGVLAEHNHAYSRARPLLQQIAARSWRFSLSSFSLWPRKSTGSASSTITHPFLAWPSSTAPAVKCTGSSELDHEMYELFVAPVLTARRQAVLASDHALATQLNAAEAESADALFDCECCYDSVPFEQLVTCDRNAHQLCHDCVRRTATEALYGQGWARTVDMEKATIRCFAPTATQACCEGSIPADIARAALVDERGSDDLWLKFQSRTTDDALVKCRLPLHRCPFCNYAEVADTPPPKLRTLHHIQHHIFTRVPLDIQFILLPLLLVASPILFIPFILFFTLYILTPLLHLPLPILTSWTRVHTLRRPLPFTCRSPLCSRKSCTRCLTPYSPGHTCFSTLRTSLRTALEAAATAAITRTCPSCNLAFVKASGCNKLVCPCGYAMCYLCRQAISGKEGYGHFCPHFRPSGKKGQGCGECERCDLYANEDEGVVIREAALKAEVEWREKYTGVREDGGGGGGTGGEGAGRQENVWEVEAKRKAVEELVKGEKKGIWWERGLDCVVDCVFD